MCLITLDHQTIKSLRLRTSMARALIYIHSEDLAKWLQKNRRNTRTITSQTTAFLLLPPDNLPQSRPLASLREPARKYVGGGHSVTLWLFIDQGHNFHDHYTTEGDRKHLQK